MSSAFGLCRLSLLSKSQNSWVVSASLNSLHFCIRLNTFMQLAAFRRYPGIAGSEEVYNAVAICLATVSNRLKCSPNFPRKAFLKPHETIISLFRNVKRFQKLLWLCS